MENEHILSSEEQPGLPSLAHILSMLWSSRRFIGYVVGVVTVLAVIISFILPKYYKSTATILPETEKSKIGALGGLTDLASLAGVNVGEGSLVKLYPTIIKSEWVLRNVLLARYHSENFKDSVDLIQIWNIREATPELTYEKGLKILLELLDVSMDPRTSVVTVSIETKEAQLSADIVNEGAYELDRFIRTKRTTNASEQRKWVEARLSEVKADLANSENALKDFREKNRRVFDSPELLLQQERFLREVQINSTLYAELKKQYELVKIEEIKNIPIINVMDAGRPAALKSSPQRGKIVIFAFLLSFAGAVSYVYFGAKYRAMVTGFLRLLRIGVRA